MTETLCYQRFTSTYGEMGLAWTLRTQTASPVVKRIFLPAGQGTIEARIREAFPGAVDRTHAAIDKIIDQIVWYLAGNRVEFSLDDLDLGVCGAFQQRVLRLAFQIPRGKVSTYGGLADRLDYPRAARAVGTALARNPFPVIIPCHRAIRGDGTLGGFGGGLKMKRALLEMERVRFDRYGKVIDDCFISPPPCYPGG
jgi:methylated-DNA-[protein]-cysteine S-methyltransferase